VQNNGTEVFVLTGRTLGIGDNDLGQRLMSNFLLTLASSNPSVMTLFLLNSGVMLAAEDSDCIDELETLERNGCEVLLCTTCIEFYDLRSKIQVGSSSNMKTLIDKMNVASKVVVV
jgi:selenium metabolism protein YedF